MDEGARIVMDYYIYKDDQNVGPLAENDVLAGIRSRRFLLDDLGCRVGETEWKDLSFFFPLESVLPVHSTQPLYQHTVSAPLPQQPIYQQPTGQTQPLGSNPFQQSHPHIVSNPYLQNHMQPAGHYQQVHNPYQTGSYHLGSRFIGLFIDILIGIPFAIMAAVPFVGIIGAPLLCMYFVSRDALFGGQSVGKRVMGLRVIKSDGLPFTWADSARRNLIYFPMLFLMIPWVGHVIHSIIAAPLGLVELILILTGGQRIGDRMGNTYVVKI